MEHPNATGTSGARRRTGGRASREWFARLLALDAAPVGWQVAAVVREATHVEIRVTLDDAPVQTLLLLPRLPGATAFVQSPHLMLRYRGAALDLRLAAHLTAQAPARMERVRLEHVLAVLERDPESVLEAPAAVPSAPAEPPAPPPETAPADLESRPPARRLAWRLGLEDAGEPHFVSLQDGRVELEAADGAWVFQVEAAVPGAPSLVATDRLAVSYRGEVPPDLAARVCRRVPAGLAGLSIEDVRALVSPPAEAPAG